MLVEVKLINVVKQFIYNAKASNTTTILFKIQYKNIFCILKQY